jgi:hypothetical protein
MNSDSRDWNLLRKFIGLTFPRWGIALPVFLLLVIPAGIASAGTYYVDGGCTSNGNGGTSGCASSSGGPGAFNSLQVGLNALSSPGDILNIAGAHDTFDGTYSADRFTISGKSGSSSSPIIIQRLGYPSSTASVYIESTVPPGSWTKCTSTTCSGAPSVNETWFTTKTSDGSNRIYWARKPDGSITPRKASLADLTSQYDGYSCEGCSTLYVRWGTSLPAKANVNYASNGNGFVMDNVSNITIRGLTFRDTIRSSLEIHYPNTNITIDDNKFFYVNDSANGSGRPLVADSSVNITITNNEFAWSSSEPLHITEQANGHVSGRIAGNWIHDIGDRQVLGPGTAGTPNCTTFTSDAPLATSTIGDFSNLIVDGNIFDKCFDSTAILLESHCDGITFSNNIIRGVPLAFKWSPDNGGTSNHTSNHRIYNNMIYGLVSGAHNGAGDCFLLTGTSDIKNNVVWNNTCANILNLGVESQAGANISGNQFYNGIFVKGGGGSVISAAQATTFKSNLVWNGSISGGFGSIAGSTVSCGSNGNICADPKFVNSAGGDFHLTALSPAKDVALNTGIPSGRTADICNALPRSQVSYDDCQALTGSWDIGADEYGAPATITATLSIGNLTSQYVPGGTYTLLLNASAPVISIPGPITLTEADASTVQVSLSGTIPGTVFTGTLSVTSSVAEGPALFSLPAGSLTSSTGQGNTITSVNGILGASIIVDRTPPASPVGLRLGP